VVYGQPNLDGNACNNGGVSATSLCDPRGIAVDADGKLYVADRGNNRVLMFAGSDPNADRIYGQSDGSGSTCAAGPAGLCAPIGVGFDKGGNLFIADTNNNRVLEYDDATTGDAIADRVFGQPTFSEVACNTGGISSESLCQPTAVAGAVVDAMLLVADQGNQRVLRYNAPFCIGDFLLTPATRAISGFRSRPRSMSVKVANGPGPNDDVLQVKGRLELLEADGGIDVIGDEAHVTLATSGGVVFEETVPDMSGVHVTERGGTFEADRYGIVDTGIEYFRVKTSFLIPASTPQRDRISFKGHAIGLDLASFIETTATLKLQYESKCFTTELACRSRSTGSLCRPAR
jgi:hypothetical protein